MKLSFVPGLVAGVCLTVGLLTGCQVADPVSSSPVSFPIKSPVQLPPGVPADLIQPRTGAELTQAQLALSDILAKLPRPSYLPALAPSLEPAQAQATDVPSSQPSELEPLNKSVTTEPAQTQPMEPEFNADLVPVEAQRAYAAARLAWRQKQVAETIRQLNEALLKAPNSPEILRFLGTVYLATGNRARGSLYLEQAIKQDPNDLPSLYLLGRQEWEQSRWDSVIAIYGYALGVSSRFTDPAIPVLVEHFLAVALEQQGYDLAAAGQLQNSLGRSYLSRSTRFGHELSLLQRQRTQSFQTLGDIYCRLDQTANAMLAYQLAAENDEEEKARASLTPRLAYVYLRQGMGIQAISVTMDWVQHSAGNSASLALTDYLIAHGAPVGEMVQALRTIYDQQDQPASLVQYLASHMEPAQADALLQSHLLAKPSDRMVLEQLLKSAFAASESSPLAGRAIGLLVQLMAAQPSNADPYAMALLEQAGDPEKILAAIAKFSPQERAGSGLAYLQAAALFRAQKPTEAQAILEKSLEAQPPLPAIRLQLARMRMEAQQWDQAQQLLAPLANSNEPGVIELSIRLLQAQGKTTEAMKLVDEALTRDATNTDLVILKADLLLGDRQPQSAQAAEQLLLDALAQHPMEEIFYIALFRLYDQKRLADSDRLRQRLVRMAQQSIPNSRVARFQTALEHAQRSEWEPALRLLDALLDQYPRDYSILDLMLAVLHRSGKSDQAVALLDQRLAAEPSDRRLLAVAQRHYSAVQDQPRFLAVTEKLLNLESASPTRTRKLAMLYLQTNRAAQAVDLLLPLTAGVMDEPEQTMAILGRALIQADQSTKIDPLFEQAIARHGAKADELTFEWAMLLERLGQADRSESLLLKLLDRNPKHSMANNALGYAWTVRGKNLDRALEMIQIALQAKPDSAAILDSLGWVYYRLGQFDLAVQKLLQARNQPGGENPVILAHLGDALYQTQRPEEAVRYWKAARQSITAELMQEDPELKQLAPELDARLHAVEQNQTPPLTPAVATTRPQSPPATPETSPATTAPAP